MSEDGLWSLDVTDEQRVAIAEGLFHVAMFEAGRSRSQGDIDAAARALADLIDARGVLAFGQDKAGQE